MRVAGNALSDLLFFRDINSFLTGEIDVFRDNLLGRTVRLLGGAVMAVVTLWILIEGYRIAVGHSRDSMMVLVTRALRVTVIVGVATGLAFWALGFNHAAVWGFAGGVLNLIPYIGSAVVTCAAGVVAFLQFGALEMVALVAGSRFL